MSEVYKQFEDQCIDFRNENIFEPFHIENYWYGGYGGERRNKSLTIAGNMFIVYSTIDKVKVRIQKYLNILVKRFDDFKFDRDNRIYYFLKEGKVILKIDYKDANHYNNEYRCPRTGKMMEHHEVVNRFNLDDFFSSAIINAIWDSTWHKKQMKRDA